MQQGRRVVITGLGVVGPCGNDAPSTWDAILAGRSGVGPITRFACADWKVRIAAEIKGFDPSPTIAPHEARKMDPFAQYAVVAAHEALRDAGFEGRAVEEGGAPLGERAGVYVGSGIGGIGEIADGALKVAEKGPRALSPFFIPKCLANLAGGHIAIRYGAMGPSLCPVTACATGNHSIGEGARAIARGEADVIIAGGAEAPIIPLSVGGFMAMKALSQRNDDPATASRPFDRDRDGFVIGEGAGIVILEDLDRALARNARIYAEVIGYATTNDAHHIAAPPPGHTGAARCMKLALASAGVGPDEVGYINAHGTSTPHNDINEAIAIRAVFGSAADKTAVSSTKSMTGHLLGAAGGIEAVFTALALSRGVIPPTATLVTPDPEIDLDLPTTARPADLRVALSNAFGFGGTNATLILRRWEA